MAEVPAVKTIHMIGHGHIDPTWLWRWQEGCEEVRATFASALARMDETPAFRFTASSACFYDWMKEQAPALFEGVRARVASGEWEIAGGLWIEPDCNIPCGEAFVRQGLYAQRFFLREFGRIARVGFNPDSFGHAAVLPQIYAKLGMPYYAFMRPMPGKEWAWPGGTTFRWRAPSGDEVLACNLLDSYNADEDVLRRIADVASSPYTNAGQTELLGFFGVGNHGGGPTRAAIAAITELQSGNHAAAAPRTAAARGREAWDFGQDNAAEPEATALGALPRPEFSTLEKYFTAFERTMDMAALPVVAQELQHHARGCYSAHAEVKRLNRQVEHALMTAERLAAAAWLLDGRAYPGAALELAWKDLLFNQFHDILAGTSIPSSYRDTRDQLGAARHRAHEIINDSIQSMMRQLDTSAPGNTIVVINPLAWPVRVPVSASPIIARALAAPLCLVDSASGEAVDLQEEDTERPGGRKHTFIAQVPALGYRCYHARSQPQSGAQIQSARSLAAARDWLENDWWRIEIDPHGGHIARLYDKNREIELLHSGNVLACLADNTDTWGHEVVEWRVETGRFGGAQLTLADYGAVFARIRSVAHHNRSTAIREVTLYRDTHAIGLFLRVNWQEHYTMLKLMFDTTLEGVTATAEAPYGDVSRATNGHEQPGQQWVDATGRVGDTPAGLAVLNDGTYGYDVKHGVLRLTLLRSPAYAHHDPTRYESNSCLPIMDQGWHEMRFGLVPHGGSWEAAHTVRKGWELNAPPIVHVESAHPGKRDTMGSLLDLDAENILLSVVKQSEDGGMLVIRGYETMGESARAILRLPFTAKEYALAFGPHEIKTVMIDPRTWDIVETDLLEDCASL